MTCVQEVRTGGAGASDRTSCRAWLFCLAAAVLGPAAWCGCDDAPRIEPVRAGVAASPDPALLTNQIGMQFVLVEGGMFQMGSPPVEACREADERLHPARIGRPFYLGVHEVTVAQFRRFVDATHYRTEAERAPTGAPGLEPGSLRRCCRLGFSWRFPGFDPPDDFPVVDVSWNDAEAFCRWLTEVDGREHRLPTEAEWECACRAGRSSPSTEQILTIAETANVYVPTRNVDYATVRAAGGCELWKAGVGGANPWGLYAMQGNVAEWCSDWYAVDYPHHADDYRGPEEGAERVVRGGSFLAPPAFARPANRSSAPPQYCDVDLGFRVAISSKE